MKLLPKFAVSLGIVGIALTIAISFFSYQNSKIHLEEMYAQRVTSGGRSIADMMVLEDVRAVLADGGEHSDTYARLTALFNTLKQDCEVTFLSLVVPDEDSVTFYIDANVPQLGDDPADQIPYGSSIPYTDAARDEADMENYRIIWELYSQNLGTDVPLITDNDYGYNYTSVAPILDENGQAIAEIQYILDMHGVRTHLQSFLNTMLGIAAVVVSVAVALYILFIRNVVTKPIGRLAEFTRGVVSSGQFKTQSIELRTGDEIEELGKAFNFMLVELDHYISDLTSLTAEKERISAELDVATHIQSSMLPCIFPAFPDRSEFDIYATMDPAKEVGGDFYDFFMVDERHLAIVMADVSGKGVPAALFMVIGKTLIKDHTQSGADLGSVFSQVNDILCESNSEGLFIIAFEGVLDLATGEFMFVNAGHELPFIAKAGEPFSPYKIRAGFVLAGMEEMTYRCGSITLEPGDKIFQYTDGVTEATDGENRLYGMERLERVLRENTGKDPHQLLPLVKADIDAFVGDAPQFDDITMLCMEFKHYMKEE